MNDMTGRMHNYGGMHDMTYLDTAFPTPVAGSLAACGGRWARRLVSHR
jgi:hypothetical protein